MRKNFVLFCLVCIIALAVTLARPYVVNKSSNEVVNTAIHSHSSHVPLTPIRVNASKAVFTLPSNVASDYSIGQKIELKLPNGERVKGKVTRLIDSAQSDAVFEHKERHSAISHLSRIILTLQDRQGSLELVHDNDRIVEAVLHDVTADKIYASPVSDNEIVALIEQDKNAYLCLKYPEVEGADTDLADGVPSSELIADINRLRNLQSNPDSDNVLYIDYWGGVVTGTAWNDSVTGGAAIPYEAFTRDDNPDAFSDSERYLIWLGWMEAAEDYAAFDINVTTSEAVYNATPQSQRVRQIVTRSSAWFPGNAGGVAYVGVFGFNSDYYATGWVWNLSSNTLGMTISHEAGHQMGLGHDGEGGLSYYSGHSTQSGDLSWGPIMGAPFGRAYVQWSKGNYSGANNQEDDIDILDGALGHLPDDASNNSAAPTPLALPVSQRLANIGLRQDTSNADHYSFSLASAQNVTINLIPVLGEQDESRAVNIALKVSLVNTTTSTVVSSISASDVSPLSPLTNKFEFDGNLAAGDYRLSIEPDSPNTNPVTGFDNYGNGGLYRFSIDADAPAVPRPDLSLIGTALSATTLAPNEQLTLNTSVRNQGSQTSEATTLRYYRSTNSTINSNDVQVATDAIAALTSNVSSAQSASFNVPAQTGSYWYGVCVDSVNNEVAVNNNCSSGTQVTVSTPPDLLAENMLVNDAALSVGQTVGISARVRNIGQRQAPASTLRFYLSTNAIINTQDQLLANRAIPVLTGGAQRTRSANITVPSSEGQRWIGACVVPTSDDASSSNNCTSGVSVIISRPVDLIVTSVQLNNNQVNQGQNVTATATVRNNGGEASSSSTLRFYFSDNQTLSNDDIEFGSIGVAALSPNANVVRNVTGSAPEQSNNYWVLACVADVAGEVNINNNCASITNVLQVASGDGYEDDDYLSDATVANSGQSQTHSISPSNDVDWVAFTLDEASSARITLNNYTGDLRAFIRDQNSNLVVAPVVERTRGSIIFEFDDLAIGTYYIKIYEQGGDSLIPSYRINLDFPIGSNNCDFFTIPTENGMVTICM